MFKSIVEEIQHERETQDQEWGGAEHDDKYLSSDWIVLIIKHLGKILVTMATFRYQMIRVAALAAAAIEWYDRGSVVIEKTRPILYQIGQRFTLSGGVVFILARGGVDREFMVGLVNLVTGNAWTDFVRVTDLYAITAEEFLKIAAGHADFVLLEDAKNENNTKS